MTNQVQRSQLLLVACLLTLLPSSAVQGSSALRGGNSPNDPVRKLNNNHTACSNLSLDISCVGGCEITSESGTCTSKMFLYHGGPCFDESAMSSSSNASTTPLEGRRRRRRTLDYVLDNSLEECVDYHHNGPPSVMGEESYIVLSHVNDTSRVYFEGFVPVGGFFWTENTMDGEDLQDYQRISIYSSNETTNNNNETLLQSMVIYAPCTVDTDLEALNFASVQLFGTAIDPTVTVDLELTISSTTEYTLESLAITSTTETHPFASLNDAVHGQHVIGTNGTLTLTWQAQILPDEALDVLASLGATPDDGGDECYVDATWSVEP